LNFCHVEPDSELALGDESGPKLVEIPKELPNSNSLLLAKHSKPREGVLNVLRGVTNNFSIAHSGLGLREVVKAVIEIPPNAKQHSVAVNVFTKVDVVDFIEVSLIHVTSKN
jgi:hypothetical protein